MKRIIDENNCCGCAACADTCLHNAINMIADARGFLYPNINNNCVDCGLCKNSCPILKRDKTPYVIDKQEYYACHNNDEKEWKTSSSGGIFRVFADFVIDKGGYVVGAVYDEGMEVKHEIINQRDALDRFRGSKYVQSDTRTIYRIVKEKLKEGKWVLFTGTPCQVEALNCFLRHPYDNLITCDIICTAVPSPRVFKDYISFVEKKYGTKITWVNMKDKTQGWPNAKTKVYFDNGKTIFNNVDSDLWLKAWGSNYLNRPSCTNCRFTNYNRPGDVTIGDCWPVYHKKNSFFSPHGISQLMINTPKGLDIFEKVKDQMTMIPITKDYSWQSKLERPVVNNPQTDDFWNDYTRLSFKEISQKYWDYPSFKNRLKSLTLIMYRILRCIKRIIVNK